MGTSGERENELLHLSSAIFALATAEALAPVCPFGAAYDFLFYSYKVL